MRTGAIGVWLDRRTLNIRDQVRSLKQCCRPPIYRYPPKLQQVNHAAMLFTTNALSVYIEKGRA